ncbi:MAG: pitrilysin family protein [Candidatus Acidiferrales bacterium]|jgi:zinc protease
MKRAIKPWIFLVALFALATTAARAQQAGQQPAAPANKNGTGVVPPGVKLVPEMPPAGAPRPFHFPQAATKTLPNGLRVFVVTDHSEPAVAARLVILSAGSIKDPQGMPGVAQMTANLLTQGTEKRSAREIAEAIDFVGGSLEASAGRDSTAVMLNVVKKDLSTGLDLMSDVVLHPAFRADELDRQRQQLLSGLTVQYSDPDYLASAVFDRVVYGGSPYGWPAEGTPETAKKFAPEELAKFHDADYSPNESLLAFAGDITPEEAFAAAEKYFGAWPKHDVAAAVPPAPESVHGLHIWLIDKPDAVQTQIRAGKLGIRRGDPNYIPVEVMNRVFGGGYNSRLNTEVRVKKGLTYSAYSSFNPHRYAGAFGVGTYTRTEATVEATKLVVDLIAKMSTGEVTQEELDFARDYLAGVYPIQSETAEQVADRVVVAAAFELPADYNSTYPDRIRSVTPAQVREMAQRYLSAKDLDIVLAGNVATFRDALKKAFPDAQYEEIPFDEVNLLAPDLRKPKMSAAAATPESLAQGKEILLAAAKAAGGDALASLKALRMTEDSKLIGPAGEVSPMSRTIKWFVSFPDRARGEIAAGDVTAVQVSDGKSAWLQMGNQTQDATPMIGEFERAIALFGGGWGLYQQVLAGKVAGQSIGEDEIEGKKVAGAAVREPWGDMKLYFDPATHLLVAARYQSAGPQGASDNEQRWSDYRAVEGRQFAFSTAVYRDGVKYMESTIRQLDLNPNINDALFSKPEVAPAPSK